MGDGLEKAVNIHTFSIVCTPSFSAGGGGGVLSLLFPKRVGLDRVSIFRGSFAGEEGGDLF